MTIRNKIPEKQVLLDHEKLTGKGMCARGNELCKTSNLIAEIDEFKGTWQQAKLLIPARLSALRKIA